MKALSTYKTTALIICLVAGNFVRCGGQEEAQEAFAEAEAAAQTASADSASVGKAGRKPAPLAAGGKELAQKDKKQGAVDPAATRKLSNESGPIVIQLIIQVSE